MLDLFKPVRSILQDEPARIDNIVFRLHSRATVLLLTVCAILVTAKQFFGEPISCFTDASIDKESVNAYCWIYGTFTVSRHLNGIPGRSITSPGVGQASPGDDVHHHRYYQWVCFVLGLQAVLFYTPRALWGIWEAGTVKSLSADLSAPFFHNEWPTEGAYKLLQKYFSDTSPYNHNFYAFRFFLCEVLNFINAVGQIYLLDVFLEGQFTGYGPAVAAFAVDTNPFDRIDPMARLFPKVTKCTIHTFGSSGSVQTHDALCVLPLNVVNEKVFVFVWFWLVFLSFVSAIALIYRVIVFSQPWARIYLLRAVTRDTSKSVTQIVKNFRFGDWFLFYQLAYNVNPVIYKRLIDDIDTVLSSK